MIILLHNLESAGAFESAFKPKEWATESWAR